VGGEDQKNEPLGCTTIYARAPKMQTIFMGPSLAARLIAESRGVWANVGVYDGSAIRYALFLHLFTFLRTGGVRDSESWFRKSRDKPWIVANPVVDGWQRHIGRFLAVFIWKQKLIFRGS
jgi:hypothetical protein